MAVSIFNSPNKPYENVDVQIISSTGHRYDSQTRDPARYSPFVYPKTSIASNVFFCSTKPYHRGDAVRSTKPLYYVRLFHGPRGRRFCRDSRNRQSDTRLGGISIPLRVITPRTEREILSRGRSKGHALGTAKS